MAAATIQASTAIKLVKLGSRLHSRIHWSPSITSWIGRYNGISRSLSSQGEPSGAESFNNTHLRNIGISAHIDSGKTTLTERILYYTGRIHAIHDVRGKDGVGAKMDSMELEREKGITIQSAATYCQWSKIGAKSDNYHVNIIDTPGHVDFTIEVERALRVLDGAVLVLCGVSGVQSQSYTVDRQMKRYQIPRLAFINKLDRQGSNPNKVISQLRSQLKLNAAAVQIPVGLEHHHTGVIDILTKTMYTFDGDKGQHVASSTELPEEYHEAVATARMELLECLANVHDEMAEYFLMETFPDDIDLVQRAIRSAVLSCQFVPVFMGSAYKNKGVQLLLDGVVDYLPAPHEKMNFALDKYQPPEVVPPKPVSSLDSDPLLALAFKLDETQFGQLTYMRIYQGSLQKGNTIVNVSDGKKTKLSRIVRMHSDDMEEISRAGAGDVVAMFGIDCRSMDTFTDASNASANWVMSSMFVPEPVMSISVKPAKTTMQNNFSKALQKFTKEDPTLRIRMDDNTKETILSGMGELHLDVYLERLSREYNVTCITGPPNVNYKETINSQQKFDWLHKKQTGGAGQYARVIGYLEPIPLDQQGNVSQSRDKKSESSANNEFVNKCVGTNIPPEYYSSCEKGTYDAMNEGSLVGAPVENVRVVLQDGAAHAVDSSDQAFRTAMANAIRDTIRKASPSILEPVMTVEVTIPSEFQGTVVAGLSKRMVRIADVVNLPSVVGRLSVVQVGELLLTNEMLLCFR
jgi:elongation factor G